MKSILVLILIGCWWAESTAMNPVSCRSRPCTACNEPKVMKVCEMWCAEGCNILKGNGGNNPPPPPPVPRPVPVRNRPPPPPPPAPRPVPARNRPTPPPPPSVPRPVPVPNRPLPPPPSVPRPVPVSNRPPPPVDNSVNREGSQSGPASASDNSCPNAPNYEPCISKSEANQRALACCKTDHDIPEACYEYCDLDWTQGRAVSMALNNKCPREKIKNVLVCTAEGRDHSKCCKDLGITDQCTQFCNPSGPLDPNAGLPCLQYLEKAQKCYYASMNPLR